ncbi:hypothetical protein [Stenotrophomonas sp. 278]|uniref:hypothetical protein n=1 Tax=Stenotrophomonas sp. 278 TaxID=2479851 RepID=UPI00163B61B7|nr:hypothetical protein [Stenotrophomonas sp. 278]
MSDPMDFGKMIGGLIREALAPILKRLTQLEEREIPAGQPGRDADPEMVAEQVRAAIAVLPAPAAGKDADPVSDEQIAAQVAKHLEANPVKAGRDADQVDVEALADLVVAKLLASDRLETLLDVGTTAAVEKYFAQHPVRDGKDADPVAIAGMVKEAVAALPAPENGKDADPVTEQQLAEVVAKHLAANPPQAGADGVGLAGAMIDRAGELVITTTKGEAIRLGVVVGKDGNDGISFETASGEYDSERGFVITLGSGERRKELVLPYMVHRGFWREGLGMKSGQSITHDGALWIAKRDNASKPCLENDQDWALGARKGRDGKDGKSVRLPQQPVQLGGGHA